MVFLFRYFFDRKYVEKGLFNPCFKDMRRELFMNPIEKRIPKKAMKEKEGNRKCLPLSVIRREKESCKYKNQLNLHRQD